MTNPNTPKEWALFDLENKPIEELKYSLSVATICKCGNCYCCELLKAKGE